MVLFHLISIVHRFTPPYRAMMLGEGLQGTMIIELKFIAINTCTLTPARLLRLSEHDL